MYMTNHQDYIQNLLSSVWPEWRITGLLGKGSYSSVYEIIRDDLGSGYKCALKVLQMYAPSSEGPSAGSGSSQEDILASDFPGMNDFPGKSSDPDKNDFPQSSSDPDKNDFPQSSSDPDKNDFPEMTSSVGIDRGRSGSRQSGPGSRSSLYDREDSTVSIDVGSRHSGGYGPYLSRNPGEQNLEDFVRSVSEEIDLMLQLKGAPGIVSIEDYAVLKDPGSRTFLIRMEKLESLDHYFMRAGYVDRRDVLRLGMDICTGLSFCERSNILHRDIKPGNLFFSEKAGFKLGDFGISRKMASINEMMSMSGVGTFQYMAPEVYHGRRYNNTADLYSLGLVLYTLLNGNNPPFCSPDQSRSGNDGAGYHAASMRRLNGEKLPPPAFCDAGLGAVVCRACDPDPAKRFQTAMDFYNALNDCLEGTSGSPEGGGGKGSEGGKKTVFAAAAAAVVLVILLAAVVPSVFRRPSPSSGHSESPSRAAVSSDNTDSGDNNAADPSEETPGTGTESTDTESPEELPPASVSYTVLYVDQESGSELLGQESGSANVGDSISLNAREVEGYTPVEDTKTLAISGSAEDNVCVFEYREIPASVVYNTNGKISIFCKKYDSEKMQRLIDSFSRESGIRITAQVAGSGGYSSQMDEKITGSGDDPTLFMLSGIRDLENYGFECLDLTDSAAAQELSDPDMALRGSDGRIYGIPCIEECWGLVVNTRLLEEAGYQVSDIRGFDDLKRISEDITARKSELGFSAFTSPSIGVPNKGSYRFSEHAPTVPLYYELRDNDFRIGAPLTETYMDRFKAYIDLNLKNSVVPKDQATSRSLDDAQLEFLTGKAVFHQDGSWDAEDLQNGLNGDAVMIPMYMGMPGEENQGLCVTCGYFWCINRFASEDDKEAALQFLQWIATSEEGLRIMTEDMGFAIPCKKAKAPDNFMIEALLDERADGLTPVLQYYKSGNYGSWTNELDKTLRNYADGTGSWSDVSKAFTKLW